MGNLLGHTKDGVAATGGLELEIELRETMLAQRRVQLTRHEEEYMALPTDDPHRHHDMYTAIVNEATVIFQAEREVVALRERVWRSGGSVV